MAIREVFTSVLCRHETEFKIVSWQKSPGDKVEKGEIVAVVESDKADIDVETFYSGYIVIVVPAGESAPLGSPIALLAETEAEIEVAKQQAQKYSAATAAARAATAAATTIAPPATTPAADPLRSDRPVVSPRARKLAKEYGVAVETLNGTGPNGRITAEDVGTAAGKP